MLDICLNTHVLLAEEENKNIKAIDAIDTVNNTFESLWHNIGKHTKVWLRLETTGIVLDILNPVQDIYNKYEYVFVPPNRKS